MTFDRRLNNAYWVLKLGFGLVPIVAGLDKFTNLLVHWENYLHPAIPRLLHVQPETFMHLVGIIEIVAGVIVLSKLTQWGAYIVMLWLIGIAGQLLVQGKFLDVAVRDLVMCLGAFTLSQLSAVRQESSVTELTPARSRERVVA